MRCDRTPSATHRNHTLFTKYSDIKNALPKDEQEKWFLSTKELFFRDKAPTSVIPKCRSTDLSSSFIPFFLSSELPVQRQDEKSVFYSTPMTRTQPAQRNWQEITEIFQSEVGFTVATDEKPILATYGCGPCIAVGGYDPTNELVFVAHFSLAREVTSYGKMIASRLRDLAKKRFEKPLQIHLHGGYLSDSTSGSSGYSMDLRL